MRIEPTRICIRILSRLVGLTFLLCGAVPNAFAFRDSAEIVRRPDVSDTPSSELERWIRGDCRFSGPRSTYEACVRTIASRQPPFDKDKPDHFGEVYSPTKYVECRLSNDRAEGKCVKHILRRFDNPMFWPSSSVPMPQFPAEPKETVYRPWMTKAKYFEALCAAEAGEFIYKTAENVEGIYQIRPRAREGDYRQEDRYVMEDPYGYDAWEAYGAHGIFVNAKRYSFFEAPVLERKSGQSPLYRHFRRLDMTGDKWDVKEEGSLKSDFGFSWRGIKRARDREHNIAGGELIVVDLRTGEILAVRRGFILGGPIRKSPSEVYWRQGKLCKGHSTNIFRTAEFIERVLRPAKQIHK